MKLSEIREQTRTAKQLYWGWLAQLKSAQGKLFLDFTRDAFEQENARGEHLDNKGNWILAASLAGLAGVAAVGQSFVSGLHGWSYAMVFAAVWSIVFALIVAAVIAVWGIRVRASWLLPNPEVVLRPDIVDAAYTHVQRDLILHYLENFMSNRRMSNAKADMLQRGQWSLLAAFILAALVAMIRIALMG
jgi:hypothetical protein